MTQPFPTRRSSGLGGKPIGGQPLVRGRHEKGTQVRPAETGLGEILCRQPDGQDERTVGREAREMPAVVEAGPDMAFGIDDWAVGPGVREMRLHIGEGSRRTDAFGAEIGDHDPLAERSEEQTTELQSLMRHPYAALCFKKKNNTIK